MSTYIQSLSKAIQTTTDVPTNQPPTNKPPTNDISLQSTSIIIVRFAGDDGELQTTPQQARSRRSILEHGITNHNESTLRHVGERNVDKVTK